MARCERQQEVGPKVAGTSNFPWMLPGRRGAGDVQMLPECSLVGDAHVLCGHFPVGEEQVLPGG